MLGRSSSCLCALTCQGAMDELCVYTCERLGLECGQLGGTAYMRARKPLPMPALRGEPRCGYVLERKAVSSTCTLEAGDCEGGTERVPATSSQTLALSVHGLLLFHHHSADVSLHSCSLDCDHHTRHEVAASKLSMVALHRLRPTLNGRREIADSPSISFPFPCTLLGLGGHGTARGWDRCVGGYHWRPVAGP